MFSFENQELFTDAKHCFYEAKCSTLLHLIKIHHNILDIFYEITFLLSDVIETKSKN